ncbi:MAG: hypothetical protein IPM80_18125 [Proteobacteria bacterium]|nr:hypothetical protein [Pseudomonadota bacterium]MBK8960272.1 hypothetical protein [Pseudomonadota bacterium]
MSTLHTRIASTTLVLLLASTPSLAAEPAAPPPGAEAAALENQAATLESAIEQECRKVAREARPQCHKQRAQAVARLRAQAARKR